MAPRTGADGLLRPQSSKATATRVLLVAVAALAIFLPGCGGGSDDSGTSDASSSPTTAAAGKSGGESGSRPDGSSVPGEQQNDSTAKSSQGKQANPTSTGGKQGARIKQPKGPREPAPTPKDIAEATVASMTLSSPALKPGPESVSLLPSTYTCAGKDTWPTLRWSGIPAGTAELVLLVLNLEPVNEAFFFDWAVSNLDPDLEGLDSGALPKGAIVGRNGFGENGYSICPQGGRETYIFALYALPSSIPVRKGFDPAALRERILEVSGNSGLMAVSYG